MDKYYAPGEKIKDYTIISIVGEGRYGIVYLAETDKLGKCIIKQLKNDMLKSSKSKLFYEQEILKNLNDEKFPTFIEKIDEKELQGYVLEYIPGVVLEDLLMDEDYVFPKSQIYTIASQLLEIISILQQNNIVHRDIRPPNVIIKENNDIVLIDFGLARYIDHKKYTQQADFWYLGDFLIHLFYTSCYEDLGLKEQPWFDELNITDHEKKFLKKLMAVDDSFMSIEEIENELNQIKNEIGI